MKKKVIKKVVVKKPISKTAKKPKAKIDYKALKKEMDVLTDKNLSKFKELSGLSREKFDKIWIELGLLAINLDNHAGIYLLQAGVRCLQKSEADCVEMGITKELSTPF